MKTIFGKKWPMVVHYNVRWVPDSIVAICLGRHVFTNRAWLSQWVLDHEEEHVRQYAQYGILSYLVRWFYWTWKVGYHANPFEVEADQFANEQMQRRWQYEDWVPEGLWSVVSRAEQSN